MFQGVKGAFADIIRKILQGKVSVRECPAKPPRSPLKAEAWGSWNVEGRKTLRDHTTAGGILKRASLLKGKFGGQKSIHLSLNSFDGKSVSAVFIPRNRAPYQPGDFRVELARAQLQEDSAPPTAPLPAGEGELACRTGGKLARAF